jgi:hypothetical protein
LIRRRWTYPTNGRRRRGLDPEVIDVRTVRTECLDWIPICNRRHLDRVPASYVDHHNTARPHRGIDLNMPIPPTDGRRPSTNQARHAQRADVLGGPIHEYRHAA